jgi:hypothetical protein
MFGRRQSNFHPKASQSTRATRPKKPRTQAMPQARYVTASAVAEE